MTPEQMIERLPVVASLLDYTGNGDMAEDAREAAAMIAQLTAERDALLQKPIDLAQMDSEDDEITTQMIAYYWCEQAQIARAERDAAFTAGALAMRWAAAKRFPLGTWATAESIREILAAMNPTTLTEARDAG